MEAKITQEGGYLCAPHGHTVMHFLEGQIVNGRVAELAIADHLAAAGPDGLTNWDRLPGVALYRSHFSDGFSPTSHGGGTVHAWGVKVAADSYGTDGGAAITARSGADAPLLVEAMRAGLAAGIVQTGQIAEPGTGVFLASSPKRSDYAGIASTLLASGADVILTAGEKHLIPAGVSGRHGAGARTDGRDLVAEARAAGYAVVFTREELSAAVADPAVKKLLGVFACDATYHALPEEELARLGLAPYALAAPTVAEMTDAALRVLTRSGKRFALVVEEEGTDDFANVQNASGLLEAFLGRCIKLAPEGTQTTTQQHGRQLPHLHILRAL